MFYGVFFPSMPFQDYVVEKKLPILSLFYQIGLSYFLDISGVSHPRQPYPAGLLLTG